MAARARRGPAPIASFDHDGSDESSPEAKQNLQLPEIREEKCADPAGGQPQLAGPRAPRIDISRASSSSHHDSRDSSPELALLAGEDGALDLRSSTEELAFLEGAPGPARRADAPLLAASGRSSRVSSVASQCSALSAFSRLSAVSAASGATRSPSPHKLLLETSFCGPRPIETDPEICAAEVEERLLRIAKLESPPVPAPSIVGVPLTATTPSTKGVPDAPPAPSPAAPPPGDARDRREVRTEVTVETAPRAAPAPPAPAVDEDKSRKETTNRARVEERRARSRERRDHSQPEVCKARNRSKDIIRIKLKPDSEYEDDDDKEWTPATNAARPTELRPRSPSPAHRSLSPAPPAGGVSRKSSFCSLFKSRETIASPDSPSDALRRKKSLNEGRSRSKSRERSAPPSSGGKLRGSVLSLFRAPRKSTGDASSPVSRAASPAATSHDRSRRSTAERLKYYEDTRDGIIHIPLRTPPDERPPPQSAAPRPASAPSAALSSPAAPAAAPPPPKPITRTVLPDGSIIIPLHSPTERIANFELLPVSTERPTDTRRHSAGEPRRRSDDEPRQRSDDEPRQRSDDEPRQRSVERPTTTPNASERTESTPTTPPKLSHEDADPVGSDNSAAAQSSPAAADTPGSPQTPASAGGGGERAKRRERLVFTTHVGSSEQVFCTQFSITKTPSVASEISESAPSLVEEARPARDSSGSDGGSEAGAGVRDTADAEARGLVVQESFEEELPYVPTTLPLERPLALPMVPVRERAHIQRSTASVERPRGRQARPAPVPVVSAAVPAVEPAAAAPRDKLRIRLPNRPQPQRPRTNSGGDGGSGRGGKSEWIDFEEVPERRKQPKRIQTLPGTPGEAEPSYAEPAECRCECHHAAPPSPCAR